MGDSGEFYPDGVTGRITHGGVRLAGGGPDTERGK